MNPAAKFRRKESIAGRRIAGESFLIPVCGTPLDMKDIFVLNSLGDFIWQRLDGERSLDAVIAEIVAEFDVAPGQAAADAQEFLGQLLQKGLAEEVA
jgi:hypothetical protein